MARVIQKHVKEKLEEWAKVQRKILNAEKAKNKKMAPLLEAHNEELKPIITHFEAKVADDRENLATLEKEIRAMIEADRDDDGNPKPILIDSDNATAAVEKQEGMRIVDPFQYFHYVKIKTSEFWASLKVIISKAEPIVGSNVIDDLSEKNTDFVSKITLKSEKKAVPNQEPKKKAAAKSKKRT